MLSGKIQAQQSRRPYIPAGARGLVSPVPKRLRRPAPRWLSPIAIPAMAEAGSDKPKAGGYDPDVVLMDVTDSKRVTEVADQLVARARRQGRHPG